MRFPSTFIEHIPIAVAVALVAGPDLGPAIQVMHGMLRKLCFAATK
jgi:hypothetical protein